MTTIQDNIILSQPVTKINYCAINNIKPGYCYRNIDDDKCPTNCRTYGHMNIDKCEHFTEVIYQAQNIKAN